MYLACRLMKIADSAVAAAIFSAVMVMAALRTNAPLWQRPVAGLAVATQREAMRAMSF
ncbi:hypothetical protein [Bradyrhizobium sp. RDI18]|uniref:hypothetical protein n=1 Tax=Bradyrhizobium sp. RDI18 TaxID=3367400 RepID=UPI0037168C36